jgi:hypothetical protein
MGFRPRSSWDPRFAKFFDDWASKMKEQGWDPTKTTAVPMPGSAGAAGNKPAEMMDANLLSEWIKHARKDGVDPMGALFNTSAGRGSAAGVWLKNRMAALDREEAKKAGGAWERGGVRRGGTFFPHWTTSSLTFVIQTTIHDISARHGAKALQAPNDQCTPVIARLEPTVPPKPPVGKARAAWPMHGTQRMG